MCHITWNAKNDYSSLWLLQKHLKFCRISQFSDSDYLHISGLLIEFSWSLQVQRLCKSFECLFSSGFVIAAFHSNLKAFKIPSCKTVVPWLAAKGHTAAHSPSAASAGCGIEQEEKRKELMGQVSAAKRKKEEEVKQIKFWEGNHFPPPTSSPVPSQSSSSWGCSPKPLPQFWLPSTTRYLLQNIPLVSLGQLSWLCFLSTFCATPSAQCV